MAFIRKTMAMLLILVLAACLCACSSGNETPETDTEDFVFGSSTADARHRDSHVLEVFEAHRDVLADLF